MAGRPYLNKLRGRRASGDHDPEVTAGVMQEWREGVSNHAPVDEKKAREAAGRARVSQAGPRSGPSPATLGARAAKADDEERDRLRAMAHKPVPGSEG